MPPKEKKESSSGFTARDLDLLAAAIQSTKAPVEIDYKVFAEKAGLGGAPSAKASWHGLKKKMEKLNGGGGVAVASPSGAPDEKAEKGSKKRKVHEVDEEDGEGDGKEEISTAKAAKKGRKAQATNTKGKKAAVVKAEAEEDEHVDGTPMSEGKDPESGEADGGEEKSEGLPTEEVGENIKVEN
ncbi:hypothetical protein KC360_g169 [Hortaea werneckii]|uniref:Uncharacterized protein n=1 Tax=Hortaea werneckii TaxID=91943 RepID=A0A3M7FTF4_HORWE|nr:hypothetical protein KC325_g421 [Hortaea werneckii]KAI7001743.1 hypothetical protein KC359_g286 [Hortaea werneckii]KAI7150419.1 hypothetical protein KC344_g172 [Hortaea werneckii]KAI7180492.1 hypothetical protein KC360_g169 [Hortaea werneckii]KAI7514194.1 hypothetical protein KC347_g805 [Hortaea werneckii]